MKNENREQLTNNTSNCPDSYCKEFRWVNIAILISEILYIITIFLLCIGVFRLLIHWCRISQVPSLFLIASVVIMLSVILVIIGKWRYVLGGALIIFCIICIISVSSFLNALLAIYKAISDWCLEYAKSDVISNIFMTMGVINFSFGYVISARDKQFCSVPLSNIIQELFPKHGQMFLFYTFLTLVGLYSSGMNYGNVALVCLVGALLAFASTCIVAIFFTFSHQLKQDVVEYYLCNSPHFMLIHKERSGQDINFSRTLITADYIASYYKTNGSVPLTAVRHLWSRMLNHWDSIPPISPSLPNSKSKSKGSIGSDSPEDITAYIQHIESVAEVWRHMLRNLSSEQQNELICKVLKISLVDKTNFEKQCETFFKKPQSTKIFCVHSLFPLCGLVSYLRSNSTSTLSKQYWSNCQRCIQKIYQINLLYPRSSLLTDALDTLNYSDQTSDVVPRLLFLLTETALLIETSALALQDFEGDLEFWKYLSELEQVLCVPYEDCSWFSEWGLSIVCSYKIDWFRSHCGMLEAYLAYQRLFDLLNAQHRFTQRAGEERV